MTEVSWLKLRAFWPEGYELAPEGRSSMINSSLLFSCRMASLEPITSGGEVSIVAILVQ